MKNGNKKKRKRIYRDRYKFVALRLLGKDLDPDKITKALALHPVSSQPCNALRRKAERIYNTNYGHWNLGSRLPRNSTLQNHVKDILEQIRPKKKILRRILRNVEADLNIAVQPHEDLAISAYTFPAEILSEFVSLGIYIRFSVHIPHK
ncbi:MAG: DUF4279 domain-containing protein [Sedimentisphaerales bacterium]